MPLFIVAANPRRPVGIFMAGSVGSNGHNDPADARVIQSYLNAVPPGAGGPPKPLTVDGKAGPLTVAAIRGFQQRHTRVADGRVDFNGATLRALTNLVATRFGSLNIGSSFRPISPAISLALGGPSSGFAAQRGDAATVSPSNWKVMSTAGAALGIPGFPVGITTGKVTMQQDSQPGLDYAFFYTGESFGVSVVPFSVSASLSSFPSVSSRVATVDPSPQTFLPSDFVGPILLVTAEASLFDIPVGVGGSLTAMNFINGGSAQVAATQAMSPNAGISLIVGGVSGFL